MSYRFLASDYDGTLATDGRVGRRTIRALGAARDAGVRLVLVTGRRLDDLASAFPESERFDAIVGENGALLAIPGRPTRQLAPPPPPRLLDALRARGVPFVAGQVVVATWEPHAPALRRVVDELDLGLAAIANKEALMVLPPGTDKRSGLDAAVAALGGTMREVVAVGDAENDEAMLRAAGCGIAVANALPSVRAAARVVTRGARGAGVEEVARRLAAGDLP